MKISEKLKSIRKTEDYTQQEFAEILGVDVTSIQNYENERIKPTLEAIVKLCKIHPEYTLWLITGQTNGNEQIDPTMKAVAISNNKELV